MATKKVFDERDLKKRLGPLTVGKVLRSWRLSEEMSLKDFGKLVGFSASNLSKIERGLVKLNPAKVAQIAKVLGVSEAVLLKLAAPTELVH